MSQSLDLFKLDGKVALVTGGGRGLGYIAAEGMAEAGANVAICGRDVTGKLKESLEKLKALGRDCIAIKCDVSKEEDVVRMAQEVKDHYGRCDILVNNAGIGGGGPVTMTDTKVWDSIMATNLRGPFLCCREIGKIMIAQKSGSVINLSSENGQVGFSMGMSAYATTKIGVIGMTRSLAVEWGKFNIRVNALLPGNMEEGMMEAMKDKKSPMYQFAGEPLLKLIPLKKFGNADDVKGCIVFLASEASRYLTGSQVVMDGGFIINSGL